MLVTWGASRAFDVASLFSAGEQGWVYDPSNLSSLFQDAAGTTPVTAMEQPVGLQLDLSGRGNHRRQTTSANRPVVSARVNQWVGTETLSTQTITTRAASQTMTFTGTGSVTLSGTATGVYTAGTYTITTTAGSLIATVVGSITKADIRETNQGVNLPPYQRVNTSTDYNTAGFPVYIKANGSNQFMVSNAIEFTATDKMTVWAGVRKLSDAAAGYFIESSAAYNTNNGSFLLSAPDSATSNFGIATRGTANAFRLCSPFVAPTSNVISLSLDLAAATSTAGIGARFNGTAFTTGAGGTPPGGGNYGNYAVYHYARAGISAFFSGHDYGSICRGAASSAAQITAAEGWINQRTKAF